MKILVTGLAGFIGYHVVRRLVKEGMEVVGLDNINDYYDVNLKYGRLAQLGIPREEAETSTINGGIDHWIESERFDNFRFIRMQLEDREKIQALFHQEKFDMVCHLGAQAGVRYSLENPYAYIDTNISGFLNILEGCRHNAVKHLVYASSSSVYGLNENIPFSTSHNVDHPASLYAATKKSGELMAHSYSSLYKLPVTGLRFFSVYGPWGRPDMALFIFVRRIIEGKTIEVYNHGRCKRDFTYIDDIVTGIQRVLQQPPQGDPSWDGKAPNPASSSMPYRVYNIGNDSPVSLMEFIHTIEENLGKKAKMKMLPMQPGDVLSSWADVSDLHKDFGYRPVTSIKEGIREFIEWYLDFYRIKENKEVEYLQCVG
ncbi:MAG: NAD-dependent epimerase [bacterium]|nr:NAD-dependent epimerase [bacterium]